MEVVPSVTTLAVMCVKVSVANPNHDCVIDLDAGDCLMEISARDFFGLAWDRCSKAREELNMTLRTYIDCHTMSN